MYVVLEFERDIMVLLQNGSINEQANDNGTTEVKIIECDQYSRCVGYYTLTKSWNNGKKSEWMDRKFVKINKD